MTLHHPAFRLLCIFLVAIVADAASGQAPQTPSSPAFGQPGKDVVWIPSPKDMVEKMLDMAQVTPRDYVIDLGSGDGRNIIAAAKRGARALGVEYNPDLVELSKRLAITEGVTDKATFVQGDMFVADISQATVLVLFLIPDNLHKLMPKFLALKPGTRIVSNTYTIGGGWGADETDTTKPCMAWCSAHLYFVPAKVEGAWRLEQGDLTLEQEFQNLSGTMEIAGISLPVENGKLRGEQIEFSVNGVDYIGRVNGDSMAGTAKGRATSSAWTATRASR